MRKSVYFLQWYFGFDMSIIVYWLDKSCVFLAQNDHIYSIWILFNPTFELGITSRLILVLSFFMLTNLSENLNIKLYIFTIGSMKYSLYRGVISFNITAWGLCQINFLCLSPVFYMFNYFSWILKILNIL